MESETREKLKEWSSEFDKLDEAAQRKEAEAWLFLALSIFEKDADFQEFLEREKKV